MHRKVVVSVNGRDHSRIVHRKTDATGCQPGCRTIVDGKRVQRSVANAVARSPAKPYLLINSVNVHGLGKAV